MKKVLFCSSNPLLIKNVYGVLRDDGYAVDTVEHPALAVKMVLWHRYQFVIVDSDPFGMSSDDAVQIIRSVAPGMPVLLIGSTGCSAEAVRTFSDPLDLEVFKQTVHSIAVQAA